MKLYGHHISLTTLQVLFLLAEKGASADLQPVDVFSGEQKAPAHRALHPFGHIPVLEDDGYRLYETHAILRYLDRTLPGVSFQPIDPHELGRMDQWLCIEQNYLIPAAKKTMARGYAQMMRLPDPGEAVVEEGRRELRFALEQFAVWIADRSWVAGGAFSLADICWCADVERMTAEGPEAGFRDDPRVQAWWMRVSTRPAWTAAQTRLALYEPAAPAQA